MPWISHVDVPAVAVNTEVTVASGLLSHLHSAHYSGRADVSPITPLKRFGVRSSCAAIALWMQTATEVLTEHQVTLTSQIWSNYSNTGSTKQKHCISLVLWLLTQCLTELVNAHTDAKTVSNIHRHAVFFRMFSLVHAGKQLKLQRHLKRHTFWKQTNPSEMPRWLRSFPVFLT